MKLEDVQKEVKRFTRIQKILISLIVVLLLFGVISLTTGGNALTRFGYDAFTSVKYSLIDHPVEVVKNWTSQLEALKTVYDENDELKKMIASQKMYKAELDEKTRIIEELEKLYDLEVSADYEKIGAEVLARDPSTWSNIVTLNKGSKDGIEVDMAVICAKGLIGKVSEVNAHTSKVKLLTTENNDASVSIKVELSEGTTTDGILEHYDAKNKKYSIQLFDANAKIEKGMKIITSGNGGVFPPGILVGKVSSEEDSYDNKGKKLMGTPSVNFNDFSYVAILKVK
ncbi:MAG: rod shape-determining protein MreC [Erysipelotrichia bacterium]|nr:rod shape-determining protein MreC [Erysipelotrichia bacterium]NCC54660.1 rod shape-determining protein MreC [Erysipelotrichia bacterium]